MARVSSVIEPIVGELHPGKEEPLHRQLYRELRNRILAGKLWPGSRLPASRAMARQLRISRNTVLTAFDQLIAEGLVESRRGSGCFVAGQLIRQHKQAKPHPEPPLSRAALASLDFGTSLPYGNVRPFRSGVPALDHFPMETWTRMAGRSWRSASRASLSYADPRGLQVLREALAGYLANARAVDCDPGQILIVSGSQQAIYLIARTLLNPGDHAFIEDPCYSGARWALAATGARIVPIPVDDRGFSVRNAQQSRAKPRLIYLTPSNQSPLAISMPVARRQELLAWAEAQDAWILEDDYDSEFRYVSRPLPSLYGLAPQRRVIYAGSCSKVLAPGLRLGYLVLPEPLVKSVVALRSTMDRGHSVFDQLATAEFINTGNFARHLRRMRSLYAVRRQALINAAQKDLPEFLNVEPPDAGLHAVAWLRSLDEATARRVAQSAGIDLYTLSQYSVRRTLPPAVLLGFGAYTPAQIRAAMKQLAVAFRGQTKRRSPRQ